MVLFFLLKDQAVTSAFVVDMLQATAAAGGFGSMLYHLFELATIVQLHLVTMIRALYLQCKPGPRMH